MPPGNGWRGVERNLNRIQAAVYDLMFGHFGLVSEIRSLVRGDFPKVAKEPSPMKGASMMPGATRLPLSQAAFKSVLSG